MRAAGVSLPRTSYSQFNVGTPVLRSSIQAGDLVFFDTDGSGALARRHRDEQLDRYLRDRVERRDRALDLGSLLGSRYVGARRVA